jgi:hypothetical protein
MFKVCGSFSITNVSAAKQAVFHLIRSELGNLLDPNIYPEVTEICKQLKSHSNLSQTTVSGIINANTTPEEFQKHMEYILSQNLFLVDAGSATVYFQNR